MHWHSARMRAALALGAAVLFCVSCKDVTGARHAAGGPLWRTPLAAPFATSDERPAADGQRLYALPGGVVTFDAATGAILWTHRVEFTVPANLVARDGRVMGAEGVAFALDAATGRELWRFTPDAHGGFGESTADDRAFYFGTASHRLYALDETSGALLWSTDLGPDWPYTGIVTGVTVSGDTVYAAAEQFNAQNGYVSTGWIFAVDRATGRILWSYRNGSGIDRRDVSASPAVAGDVLVAGDLGGNAFFGVDRTTGRELWRIAGAPGHFGPDQPPVVVGGTAYVASEDDYVYAVDPATGRLLWKTKTPASNHGITVCGDRVFVDWLGLSILDRLNGRVLYQSNEESDDYATSGFATDGQRAFVLGNRAAYAYLCG